MMCDLCNLLVKTIKYTLELRKNKLLLNYSLITKTNNTNKASIHLMV